MKKIKILRIIARLNIGGPAIHTILLTDGLDKSRFDSLLVCGNVSKDEADMSYYAAEKNVKPYFISELKRELNLFNDIVAFKKIFNLIKTEQPDIIHTHTAKAGTLGRLAAISYVFFHPFHDKRIQLVHTFHGHIFQGYFNKFITRLFILIEKFLAFFTCRIITVSDSVKNELISLRIAQKNKIAVIPLGLELDRFLGISIRNNNVLNIGIVGRLVIVKNHRLFLEAANKVIKNNPQIKLKFNIVGDGELKEELKSCAYKLGINAQVNFLGWQKDVVKAYSELDIVALTSINEGTPVSLIEAMASGKAVIATDVGGVRDLLGKEINIDIKPDADFKILERGIIVKPDDSFSLAKALMLLLRNDNLRQELGIKARDFVRYKFAKERLLQDIENLYNSILILNPC